ncbi:replication initiator protein [Microviridae sp.]|nr:replication initiator protein [Microviridae sp.]
MTCYYPNEAFVQGFRASGTKIIKFGLPDAPNKQTLKLPCGQCYGCRLDYSQMWAVRSMHEAQLTEDNNCMVTLTYDENHLPLDGSLNPPDVQKFLKRLRKRHTGQTIRFLAAGEYGPSVGQRPHYHILLFGYRPNDLDLFFENEGIPTYTSESLQRVWNMGFTTVSDLTIETAAYVARYVLKKVNASKASPGDKYHAHYERVCQITGEVRQRHPEFARMSNRPGLARDWYAQYHSDIFPHDTTWFKSKKIKTPRYYENLLRSTDPSTFEDIKQRRLDRAIKFTANNTPERLRVREKVKIASMSNFTRTLHV